MLYEISIPNAPVCFTSCRSLARKLVKAQKGASSKPVEDLPAPAGAVSVEVRKFRVEFMPEHRGMVQEEFEGARYDQALDAYEVEGGQRGLLYVSPFLRNQVIKKLKQK